MSNNSSLTGWKGGEYVIKEVHFIILALLIVAVNSCVIVTVWRKSILQKWQNYLLVSLAFSDLSTGLVGLPLAFLCSFAISSNVACPFCSVAYIFTKFVSVSTILHLLIVTYERFMFIVYPFYYERITAKHARCMLILAVAWLISLAVALVPFAWTNPRKCGETKNAKKWLYYNIITVIFCLLIPMIMFIYAFVSMFLVARVHIRRQERLLTRLPGSGSPPAEPNMAPRKEARVAVIFILMWTTFAICWGPYFALAIIDEWKEKISVPEKLWQATDVLRFLTSLLNPLLYSFLKKDFCQALGMSCCVQQSTSCGCCLPYDKRFNRRCEVPLHSNVARRLSDTGHNALMTQASMV